MEKLAIPPFVEEDGEDAIDHVQGLRCVLVIPKELCDFGLSSCSEFGFYFNLFFLVEINQVVGLVVVDATLIEFSIVELS